MYFIVVTTIIIIISIIIIIIIIRKLVEVFICFLRRTNYLSTGFVYVIFVGRNFKDSHRHHTFNS
jgi:hypothetical protein